MERKLIDIEIYPNFFMLGIKDYYTGDTSYFEVSPWVDNRKELYNWLCFYKGFVIGFNTIYYDNMVLAYIKKEFESLHNLTSEQFCFNVKLFSDKVINTDKYYEEIKVYKYTFGKQWTDIDLFLYWSKGLRQSKKISLKGLGIQLGYPVVMELPYDPEQHLTKDQAKEIKVYNLQHDLGILKLLLDTFTGKSNIPLGNLGTVQLRKIASEQYGINAWSYDAPKIASEVLLKEYCQKTQQNTKEVRSLRFDRPTISFRELFKEIDFDFQSSLFKDVYEEWMSSFNTFSKEFVCVSKDDHGLKISCGIGGLHNILANQIYEEENSYEIIDIDIELIKWLN